jgi:hypothetical protein
MPDGHEVDSRAKLRAALDALREDQERHAALVDALNRAETQWAETASQVSAAEAALAEAQATERQRQAWDFVSGVRTPSPVKQAETTLGAAQQNLRRLVEIKGALGDEIEQLAARLARRQDRVHACLADLICNSQEFHALLDDLDRTWSHIRGLRITCRNISQACAGHMSQAALSHWQSVPSLNPERLKNVPANETPIIAWATALEALLQNADFPLPAVPGVSTMVDFPPPGDAANGPISRPGA